MDTEAVVQSEWAREFKEDSPVSYAEALRYATSAGLEVEIKAGQTVLHEPCFAIVVADAEPEFWMSHKATLAEAVGLCRSMGWKTV